MKLTRISAALAASLISIIACAVSLTPKLSAATGDDAAQPLGEPGSVSESVPDGDAGVAARLPAAFEGVPWQLVAYGSGDALTEVKEGRGPAIFHFDGGTMAGSAGCNRLMGTYTLEAERLGFDPRVSSTMMACPEPLMAQDQAVSTALAGVASYRHDAKQLELLNANGQPLLRFTALEPSPLTEQAWGLTEYNNGKHAMVSVLDATEITLELRDDGTLGGSDGCNRYMSGYTLEGQRLSIGPLATTRMACRGPEGAAEQAAAFARALETVTGYRIEGGELTLVTGEGQPAARFRALAVPAPVPEDSATPAAGQDAGRPDSN
ncbi:MAG: META domain-containing protein [Chromatiaceae bacterium]